MTSTNSPTGAQHWLDAAGIYRPGEENCLSLRGGGDMLACPWIPTCGKFTPAYQAADAAVSFTNHHNFIQGTMRVGIQIDGRPVRSVTVREFVLRARDFVIIDEIDAFQAVAVDCCATTVDLHSRRPWTAEPQVLDTAAKHLPLRFEDQVIEPFPTSVGPCLRSLADRKRRAELDTSTPDG
ncbi:hypothetical protein [Streptomyces solincola]|uniref:hypothetical protein n=1 Tax=Streptomyces solincola TaxID=2100817 RepID=UPI0015E39736|nr:hypothetical protein [Streptomyces solincola]